jgi:hypothetical protein
MLLHFYRNTLAAIKQWFETIYLAISPAPVPVRVRIDKPEMVQRHSTRQQRMFNQRFLKIQTLNKRKL